MTFVQRLKSLFSIHQLIISVQSAIRRFPLVIAIAVVGTASAIVIIEDDAGGNPAAARVLFAALLGFALAIGIRLLAENLNWSKSRQVIANIGVLLVLVGYWFFLPAAIFEAPDAFFIRSLLWGGSFLLFIPLAPVLGKKLSTDKFWESAATVLSAAVIAGVTGMIIFLGVAAAIGSVDTLFNINIVGTRYPDTWAFIMGIIASTLFLASLPSAKTEFVREEFLAPWRVLALYILVPLVCVYFVILYIYLGSVVIDWEWPESLVSYLVIAFSLVGLFSAVALHGLEQEKRWLRWFIKSLHIAIIPQAFVLLWAVWFPISHYGFTEKRYMVVLFGLWLIVVSLYYLVSKKKDWRLLPASLIVIMLLSSIGPWGALGVSRSSQVNRLMDNAEVLGIVDNGRLMPTTATLDHNDPQIAEAERQVSSILSYLINTHGTESVELLLPEGAFSGIDTTGYRGDLPSLVVTDVLGLEYSYDSFYQSGDYIFIGSDRGEALQGKLQVTNIAPYDYSFTVQAPYTFEARPNSDEPILVTLGEVDYSVALDIEARILSMTPLGGSAINVDFRDFLDELITKEGD
ncbi:MAG: hypothetical protein COW24_00305, partial [Candidatus Kerfeldbacteria bacterium CG15_BIG_FIL_POST_REV_8_21_14_020_45_12]